VEHIQGTKIAAAPDLMASLPAMLSAPPESEGEESADDDDLEGVQHLNDNMEESISTSASDLPVLPDAFLSPEDLPSGSNLLEGDQENMRLHALLPVAPGAKRQDGVTAMSVTATPTPDGTVFSFEQIKSPKMGSDGKQKQSALLEDAAATASIAEQLQEATPPTAAPPPLNSDEATGMTSHCYCLIALALLAGLKAHSS
jgi:hypothetical protein